MSFKNTPLFSIIIPTYNSGTTLSIALDSIVNQTFRNWEVLIMDGLSTDDTIEIVENYQKQFPNIKIFSEKDNGIYDAMNKGIDLTKGEWLYFMGSDDSLYKVITLEKISNLTEIKNFEVVYGNVKIIGETGWASDGDIYDGEFTTEKILNKNISHQAIFYNTKFVKEKIGYFNLNYEKSADWDFNLRCWAKSKFLYDNNIIANFRADGFSSNSTDFNLIDDFVTNVLNYFNINLFHPLLNNSNFIFYNGVKKMQKHKYPFRFKMNMLTEKIIKRLK